MRDVDNRAGERKVIVDADACPSLNEILRVSRAHKAPVVLVGNDTQNLQRFNQTIGVSTVVVPSERDAADYAIVALVHAGDIVITADIGLAALTLSKKADTVSPRGKVYNPATIDTELFLRHEGQKIRRAGGRTKGPAPYTGEDRERLVEVLKRLLEQP
ncbi:MAG: YaiI/YqxD family protein [Candidatus Aquicultor sp.]